MKWKQGIKDSRLAFIFGLLPAFFWQLCTLNYVLILALFLFIRQRCMSVIEGGVHPSRLDMVSELVYVLMFISKAFFVDVWRRSGLMVSALNSGSSGPGSSPGWGHCVMFLGKTLYSHSASLQPGIQMGTSNMLGVTLWWTSIPSRGE